MFKLKDNVYSINFGWGTVKEILGAEYNSDYKVNVLFENGRTESFTLDGKYFEHGLRDLFFEEIPIPKSALERPRKTAEQMLKECKGITFNKGNEEPKYYLYYKPNGNVGWDYVISYKTIGVKYISKEDMEKIISECRENNRGVE